jgi:hypothetical protein
VNSDERVTDHVRALNSGTSAEQGSVHLVLGYDASPASQGALTVATDLARRLHAQHHVVLIGTHPPHLAGARSRRFRGPAAPSSASPAAWPGCRP